MKLIAETLTNTFGFCPICDNHTPRVWVDGDTGCQYCWEAYGELN